MRRRFGILTLVGALAAGGLLGVAVGTPLLASATSSTPTPSSPGRPAGPVDRVTAIKDALKGLVSNGTITQSQADAVASTLATTLPRGGFGRFGPGGHFGPPRLLQDKLDTAAKVLGMTTDQVKAALAKGTTLATLAKQKGVAESTLVNALVTQAASDIDQAVKAGNLTSTMAARLKTDLQARITQIVEHGARFGHGWRGGPPPARQTPQPPQAPPTSG